MKKIWHISDTHGYHDLLVTPNNIFAVIHSGDFSNYKDINNNIPEALKFLEWYKNVDIKYKILIAGNHDAYPAKKNPEFRELCKEYGIIYLENESINIEGINIYGSPNTPQFGDWHFMKNRNKLDAHWSNIPDVTDILVVHGPPKGIMDLSYNREGILEFCGCKSLRNHVLNRIKPKLFLSGHIHDNEDIVNQGIMELSDYIGIKFSNGSVVKDRRFGFLSSNGNILEIE